MAKQAKRALMTIPIDTFGIKGVWMWEYERETANYQETIDFCKANFFNEIYITFNNGVVPDSQYRTFIASATSNGIDVHALFGSPLWALDGWKSEAMNAIESVKTFNAGGAANERFKGIQMDNEAYLLDDWEANKRAICNQWVANTRDMVAASWGGGMIFGAAYPFWLDEIPASEIDAAVYPLHKQFIDMMDYYAIMSYMDTANAVQTIVETELSATVDKKIMFGLETTEQSPSSVTFYDNGGYGAMQSVLLDVEAAVRYRPSYRGVAVHDYKQYHKEVSKTTQKAAKRVQDAKRNVAAK